VSLGHSEREQKASGGCPAVEPLDHEPKTELDSLSSLAEEAVPVRSQAARELDQMRQERIRAVVGSRSGRLPRPSANARVLWVGGIAVALLALIAALSLSGEGRSASDSTAAKAQRPVVARVKRSDSRARRPQRLLKATSRRRAGIRAKRKAARRPAERKRAHRSAAHAEAAPSQSEAPLTESQAPISAPPPPAAATESAPTAASSPPSSTSSNPAQEEFGFEH
jgi:hypothetical protein